MENSQKSKLLIIVAAILSAILAILLKDWTESLMPTMPMNAGIVIYRLILGAALGALIGWLISLANK